MKVLDITCFTPSILQACSEGVGYYLFYTQCFAGMQWRCWTSPVLYPAFCRYAVKVLDITCFVLSTLQVCNEDVGCYPSYTQRFAGNSVGCYLFYIQHFSGMQWRCWPLPVLYPAFCRYAVKVLDITCFLPSVLLVCSKGVGHYLFYTQRFAGMQRRCRTLSTLYPALCRYAVKVLDTTCFIPSILLVYRKGVDHYLFYT